VAEPYKIPNSPNWVGSTGGSAAVFRAGVRGSPSHEKVEVGEGYAAVKWRPTMIISCYAPPSWDLAAFERCLERVGAVVRGATTHSIIVAGNFNAVPGLGE